ncbi:MAG: ATPase, T2SS/T4P/T4SS family [Candidatus Pacearchaeota archaeon]
MSDFEKGAPLYKTDVRREGGEDVLYVNYFGAQYVPSVAEYPSVMQRTMDQLMENPNVSRIVFSQQKNYTYGMDQTSMLLEIAQLYVSLLKQEQILSQQKLITNQTQLFSQRYNQLFSFLLNLKRDPIAAYQDIRRLVLQQKIVIDKSRDPRVKSDYKNYLNLLQKIHDWLEDTKLIQKVSDYLDDYNRGDREIYKKFFSADVVPNFTFTRLVADLPEDAEIVDQYKISGEEYDESLVTVLRVSGDPKMMYHITPPEYNLSEDHNELLNLARKVLIEHQPKAEEFTDTERIRNVFFNIAKDLVRDLSQSKGIPVTYSDLNKLATILVRNTIGFGLIEVLLQDKKVHDISLNAPIPKVPVYVVHADYDDCYTNIRPSQEDADSWAAKFRMASGRPLDEANPILDTQLSIGKLSARVAIVQQPLSPDGLSYSIRRHREDPWTLPLFIQNKMVNPFAAGLYSFLIDGARTMLIAGTRSSGKTSLLGSLMLEILSNTRIITVEDTMELPIEAMRDLDYDVIRMLVSSAMSSEDEGISAAEGIRTSLRLGDSSLIVGEIRSEEAKALYEAMRVGALANVVAGTIHGGSPYSVFDRVVNDLGVPATSFKATDTITVANPIKSADGLNSFKRVVQLSEVRKHWQEDPSKEGGFVDLMKYNVEKDELEATEDLKNGNSNVVKDIASNVKSWAGNWDAVYDNILLRADMKKELVDTAERVGDNSILESGFTTLSNHKFHQISEKISDEIGTPSRDRVFPEWQKWLNEEVKKSKV